MQQNYYHYMLTVPSSPIKQCSLRVGVLAELRGRARLPCIATIRIVSCNNQNKCFYRFVSCNRTLNVICPVSDIDGIDAPPPPPGGGGGGLCGGGGKMQKKIIVIEKNKIKKKNKFLFINNKKKIKKKK